VLRYRSAYCRYIRLENPMTKIQQATAYLLHKSQSSTLSAQRIVFMFYLADWLSALRYGQTISGETWKFGHHGPDSESLRRSMASNRLFRSTFDDTQWPHRIEVSFVGKEEFDHLSGDAITVLDYVAQLTDSLMFNQLTDTVYQTYPVSAPTRYETLDLVELAEELRLTDEARPQAASKGVITSTAA
jgi:hypothetical protein